MNQVLIFATALVAPFVLIRLLFALTAVPISKIKFHTRTGLTFHHFHYGVMLIFLGNLALLFTSHKNFALGLMGFGLGMVLDEFIATLRLPETEPEDTIIYKNSFKATLLVLITVIAIIFLFWTLTN